jgi:multidrug resistance efflux pump
MRLWTLAVLAAGLLAMGGTAGYDWYGSAHYVSTDDASVEARVVYVYPPAAGLLAEWNAYPGERVRRDTVLGAVRAAVQGSALPAGLPGGLADSLGDVPVLAPGPGVVVREDAVAGEQVDPALGLPLAAVIDPRGLWVQANVDETRIRDVRPGEAADVWVDGLPGRVLRGRVAAVLDVTEAADVAEQVPPVYPIIFQKEVQRIPVKILLEHAPSGLDAGMDAEVRIHVAP